MRSTTRYPEKRMVNRTFFLIWLFWVALISGAAVGAAVYRFIGREMN